LLTLTETTTIRIDAEGSGRVTSFAPLALDRAVSDLVWPILAVIVFACMEREVEREPMRTARALTLRFAGIGLALAPFYLTWGPAARLVVHGGGWPYFASQIHATAATTYLWCAFLYSMITLTAGVLLVSRRARRHERTTIELKARLAHAELELLRAPLEPHFLFNALNTIASLIRVERPDLATAALAKLSELLRYVVEASRQDRVPLAWELDFVTNYLELQQMRFGHRLQFVIHQTTLSRACDVPPLLLQPLIENAVVHGVARTSEPVHIDVHVSTEHGELRVEVDNTRDVGAPIDRAPGHQSTGVGLRNTRQRLERLYGEAFALAAGPEGAERYRVTISLPHAVASA
jgi:sensor histidine kinase YesM